MVEEGSQGYKDNERKQYWGLIEAQKKEKIQSTATKSVVVKQ